MIVGMRWTITRLSVAAPCIAMFVACASGGGARPDGVVPADVSIRLSATPIFVSAVAPVSLEVSVRNKSSVPVLVRRIRVASSAMVQYELRPVERTFDATLAPGESTTFTLLTSAFASREALTLNEPLNLRAHIDFEAGGQGYREVFNVIARP